MPAKVRINNAIFKHKWLMLFVFLIFMALTASTIDYIRKMENGSPSFFKLIVEQINEPQMMLFPMMYVLLLFAMDDVKTGSINKGMPWKLLKDAILSSAVYMLFFIAANLLYSLIALNTNNVFNNVWSYTGVLSGTHLSPLAAAVVSVALLFLRFCFLIYLINFINILTKKSHWGFWSAFLISYIDYMLYRLFLIPYPIGVLPLEHTRITYTEAYVPDFIGTGIRIPYYVSLLY